MTVFRPSLPPLSCTTTRIRSPAGRSAPSAADSSKNPGARGASDTSPAEAAAEIEARNLRRDVDGMIVRLPTLTRRVSEGHSQFGIYLGSPSLTLRVGIYDN